MQITLSGTVFTSYDVKTKNSSKNENAFEETLQNQKQQSYQTNNQLSQTSSKTSFIDPVNGEKVSVSLEKQINLFSLLRFDYRENKASEENKVNSMKDNSLNIESQTMKEPEERKGFKR